MLCVIRGTVSQRFGFNFMKSVRHFCRLKTTHCLDCWTVPTSTTGFLDVQTHFNTYIRPIDPLEQMEKDMLELFEEDKTAKACARVSLNIALPEDTDVAVNDEFFDEFSKDIRYNPQLNIVKREHHLVVKARPQRTFSFPPEDITITVEVPLQFNLNVNAADYADVHIKKLEGGWIYDVTSDKGNCFISSIKGTDIHVKSVHGNIISKSTLLAEFGTLAVEDQGVISVGKLQGRKFCLDSESGNISTGPLYLQRGEVNSLTGAISLGDIHGITEVKVKEGDISIGSVSGDLHAETRKGNITLHLSQFKNIDLVSKEGDVNTTIEKTKELTSINVKAKDISIGSDIDINETSRDTGKNFTALEASINPSSKENNTACSLLKAEAKQGTCTIDYRDWFSSLKLNSHT